MKLIKYGVTLKRLTEEDLELLRNWRNSSKVNQFMEYREYITAEMQLKWFKSINNPSNFYYIIIYKGDKIGMINEKGFDRHGNLTSESGLFIAVEKYQNTFVPVFASLILLEMNIFFLGGKDSYIKILKDNNASIIYNKKLGYELCSNQEEVNNQLYILTVKNFIAKTRQLRKAALKVSGGDPNIYLVWEKEDYESGIAQESDKLLSERKIDVQNKWEDGSHIWYYAVDVDNPIVLKLDPSKANPYKYFEGEDSNR